MNPSSDPASERGNARATLTRRHRLDQAGVTNVLKTGRRVQGEPADLSARFVLRVAIPPPGRIAIAVPKRILKRAVDRNYVKRIVREGFRHHAVKQEALDVLVSLQAKPAAPRELLPQIYALLDQVLLRARAAGRR